MERGGEHRSLRVVAVVKEIGEPTLYDRRHGEALLRSLREKNLELKTDTGTGQRVCLASG